jgi:hypothetical protein
MMDGKWWAGSGVAARRVTVAIGSSLVLALTGATGLASAAGPLFGAYTGSKLLPGSGHLEITIHVDDPTTTGAVQADCGRPSGSHVVTEDWDSAIIPFHHGGFNFSGQAKVNRITTTSTGAIVNKSHYRASVRVNGHFADRRFAGTVLISGSPCGGTSYTARRVPPPTPG